MPHVAHTHTQRDAHCKQPSRVVQPNPYPSHALRMQRASFLETICRFMRVHSLPLSAIRAFSHFLIFIYAFALFPGSCFCFSARKLRRSGCCDFSSSPNATLFPAAHTARSYAREGDTERERERLTLSEMRRASFRERACRFLCLRNSLSEFRVKTDLRDRRNYPACWEIRNKDNANAEINENPMLQAAT